jgi:hypothetical protein
VLAAAMLMVVGAVMIVIPVASAVKPRVFKNCTAVHKVYAHGIAKNFKVIKKASGLTGRPFVSAKLYAAAQNRSHPMDRDKDGVACET